MFIPLSLSISLYTSLSLSLSDLTDLDFNTGGGLSVVMDFADTGVMVTIVVSYVNLSDLERTALLSLNLHGKRKHLHWFYA